MNRSNSMSRSLSVFFLDLVTGEVRNPSIIFFFSFLFLLLDLLSQVFGGSTYPFICRSGSLKGISFKSGSTLFSILRSKTKVRLILVGFCQRRPGILKSHCFGLVAGDKCHDIADHFRYAGSGCHKCFPLAPFGIRGSLAVRRLLKAGAKPLEIPDEPIQFYVQISPCLLSRSGHCTYPFICRSGSLKGISFKSGSTLFSILRSKTKVKACCNLYLLLSLSHPGRGV
ncbi:hypothetical protein F2Q69_00052775 [Brassica cretica]|uniref:Uncharacterized protein n=1 Tax=Brassica cretica TaxID=69181 RepID=A0A8S9N177_BRACR|nr:hypothetical protein F2Q69_00052775 [Brassica cretica]